MKAAFGALPEALVDNGVFRPEAKGEGVGCRVEKAPNALDGFIGGFLVAELVDVAVFDQSMPARSSIVTRLDLLGEKELRNLVYSKTSEHIICQRV